MAQGVTIVSGGSRGLGQAIIMQALQQEKRVATFSRHPSDFIRQQQEKDPEGVYFYWQQVDATDTQQLAHFIEQTVNRFQCIDGLVNNVGLSKGQFLNLMRDADIDQLLDVNLKSIIHLSRLVMPHMLRESYGSIVNISSISGYRGFSGLSVYGATKCGLQGFSRCLAREVGSRMIRVNVVAPGLLHTDMANDTPEKEKQQIIDLTPMGRLGDPEDVVGLILFLLSDAAKFITGQTITVDGGFTC